MTTHPCGDCGTTGGHIAPGRDIPARTSGETFGFADPLCHRCYSRHYKRFRAAGGTITPKPKLASPGINPLDHQGLVFAVAFKYRNKGMDFDDVVGWGQVGLLQACGSFDESRGFKFSTYAAKAIHTTIRRAIADKVPMVRIPEYLHKPIFAGITTLSTPEHTACLQDALEVRRRCRSPKNAIDAPLASLVVAPNDDQIALNETVEQAHAILQSLPTTEATVLRLRFGIGVQVHTYKEIAAATGTNRETARLIEERAIRRVLNTYGSEARRASA